MNLFKYSTVAANNNSAVPDGFPEGWTGANVNNAMREFAAAIRTHISDASFVDETYQLATVGTKTLVRNSTTQIQINGCDGTSLYAAGRRVRIVGATTDYGYITSSSYSASNTVINVMMDASDVPNTPTQILLHTDSQIKGAAYYRTGSGNGLDADKIDGLHAADIIGPAIFSDALINGSMNIWQRGTSGSCPAATRTYHADRWWTNPAGAAVTCSRTTTTPTGSISRYAKLITGAASVGNVDIAGQRIESYMIPYIKTTVTFSAFIKNDTGANLPIYLILGTPSAQDDFTTVTQRLSNPFALIGSGASVRTTYTVDISGYTNIDNGLEVKFVAQSGFLDSGAKSVTITEIQIDRSSVFSYFRLRSIADEMNRCQRYYQKTFAYETTPAQNIFGAVAGLPVGTLAIPGSTSGGGSDNSGVTWQFPIPMRSTPAVVTFNPKAANALATVISSTVTTATVTAAPSTAGVNLSINATAATYCVSATAEAEL